MQSATLELDESGKVISYEEYHPYGTTSYQALSRTIRATAKRYRFTGKERDEESGLYYHGARYYAPWLGRWTAVDPLESKYAPLSPYNYCENNPVNITDASGMGPDDPPKQRPMIKAKVPASAPDNTTVVHPAQLGVRLLPPGSLEAAAATGEARFGRSTSFKEATIKQAPTRTAYQQAEHQRAVEDRHLAQGYNKDGSPSPLKRLEQNPTFQNAADRLVMSMINLYGVWEMRGLLTAGKAVVKGSEMATLGEMTEQQLIVKGSVEAGNLPGSFGAYLGPKRLSNEVMHEMSAQHGVEFAQVYFSGTGKSGGGGYYQLYSGTKDGVNIPAELGTFLVNHVHPAGNTQPSIWDVKYLLDMAQKGSPQRSSIILPVGKPATRFYPHSTTIGN